MFFYEGNITSVSILTMMMTMRIMAPGCSVKLDLLGREMSGWLSSVQQSGGAHLTSSWASCGSGSKAGHLIIAGLSVWAAHMSKYPWARHGTLNGSWCSEQQPCIVAHCHRCEWEVKCKVPFSNALDKCSHLYLFSFDFTVIPWLHETSSTS